MKLKEIAPEIFCLKVSIDLSEEDVNLYIFRGEVPTIIDSGTNTPEVYQAIQEALQELGIQRLEQVLLTHWHVDHAGGAENLRKDGARILIGKRDYEEWTNFFSGKSLKVFEKYAGHVWGVPQEQLAMITKYNKKLAYLTALPEEVEKIEVGAVLQAGNSTLKAILTPGHTAGHLSYYEEDLGLLFSGDFLLPDVVPYPGAWLENGEVVSGLPGYMRSLDRVEFLGARAYFPAHGDSRRTPASRCIEIRNQILRQVERYTPTGSVYEEGLELSKGKFNPISAFAYMHYVFGWSSLKSPTITQRTSSMSR
ncbi:MAG TPA: MBL fold metallo-hydrolase [Desulfitobacterium dehalogenans]|uniref:MBL fold metallo-hydrolase n=1 Tax=Desulfitobacterium dehalogenans TaxID=36854 RepID=A0A7C6Z479_9FIRM|nr:MBL fold metallo-hydrolase [Desulfitobacterium dehalogenans]